MTCKYVKIVTFWQVKWHLEIHQSAYVYTRLLYYKIYMWYAKKYAKKGILVIDEVLGRIFRVFFVENVQNIEPQK